jgi:hypothetical protein
MKKAKRRHICISRARCVICILFPFFLPAEKGALPKRAAAEMNADLSLFWMQITYAFCREFLSWTTEAKIYTFLKPLSPSKLAKYFTFAAHGNKVFQEIMKGSLDCMFLSAKL